jgi:alkanesulfonate monooxygenase SsuD/methylene tetrahydromethanopterin reductase-like flavin-dependent oxidoreductase (luciferase family)
MTRWGVLLPTFDPLRTNEPLPVAEAARRAEQLGFDSVWAGDHLTCPAPSLDAPTSLAAAATATERIGIGLSVMLLGLRQPAWAAKQLATLQLLSGGRLQLGVGVGGEFPDEFTAAGVDVHERGARLDEALMVLPDLLRGRPVTHHGRSLTLDVPALEPAVELPPVLVGGRSRAALKRAARVGDSWLPMWFTPDVLAERYALLGGLAHDFGRPTPSLALLVGVRVEDDADAARSQAAAHLKGQYGIALDVVERWTPLGPAGAVAAELAGYRAVGVEEFVLMPLGSDPLGQYEQLAWVRDAVNDATAAFDTPGL